MDKSNLFYKERGLVNGSLASALYEIEMNLTFFIYSFFLFFSWPLIGSYAPNKKFLIPPMRTSIKIIRFSELDAPIKNKKNKKKTLVNSLSI